MTDQQLDVYQELVDVQNDLRDIVDNSLLRGSQVRNKMVEYCITVVRLIDRVIVCIKQDDKIGTYTQYRQKLRDLVREVRIFYQKVIEYSGAKHTCRPDLHSLVESIRGQIEGCVL